MSGSFGLTPCSDVGGGQDTCHNTTRYHNTEDVDFKEYP
jgi:hypothetical protein